MSVARIEQREIRGLTGRLTPDFVALHPLRLLIKSQANRRRTERPVNN